MPRIKKQHLKRRKDGRYKLVYQGKQIMGRSEEEVFAKCKAYKRELEEENVVRENPTVSQYADAWLKRTKVGVSDQTYAEAACLLEKMTKRIGRLYVKDVRASDVKSVYSKDFDGLSDSYIRAGAQIYRAMFDAAVDDGICKKNPARADSAKPHKGTSGSHRAITDMERFWIENLCTGHRAHAAVMAMLYAGLRPQEAKALNVDRDVDFDAGTITVRESVHLDGANQYERSEKLKTKYSGREIPLFPPLREALQLKPTREAAEVHARAVKRAKRMKKPLPPPPEIPKKIGMLVSSADGNPVTVQAWRSAWESYVTEMETAINGCEERWYGKKNEYKGQDLPPFIRFTVRPYDLRHSFCTWCRDNGVEINTCVHWMGHADAKMILQIYDEFSPERSKREAEKLEKTLFRVQNQVQTDESGGEPKKSKD